VCACSCVLVLPDAPGVVAGLTLLMPGSSSGVGSTLPSCVQCAAGNFSTEGGACEWCPVGRYGIGNVTSSACTGECVAVAGKYCGLGMSSPTGTNCPVGWYSDTVNATSCKVCCDHSRGRL
jgi:hypothetical protein